MGEFSQRADWLYGADYINALIKKFIGKNGLKMLNDIEDIRFTARSEENLRGVHPIWCALFVWRCVIHWCRSPSGEAAQHGASAGNGARRQQTLRSRHLTGHAVDVVAMPAGVVSREWDYYAQIAARCGARRVNAG